MTLDHHDEATAQAMRVVARDVIRRALDAYLSDWMDPWVAYPDLGEQDFDDVARIARELAPGPGPQEYRAAYDHLAARTETS